MPIIDNASVLVAGGMSLIAAILPASAQTTPSQGPDEPGIAKSLWTRPGEEWPQFLGQRRNGTSPETGILVDWPDGKLRRVWSQPLGDGYGIGSVSLGRMVILDRLGLEERVRCFHAETGAQLWSHSYRTSYADAYGMGDGPRSAPVIDGQRVYTFGVEGWLHCLNLGDGSVIWKVDTHESFRVVPNFFGVGSTPVVEGDLLIAMVGGSPEPSQGLPVSRLGQVKSNGTGIVGFDKFNGQVRYKSVDELASYSSPVIATIRGEKVGLAFCRGSLVAFHPPDGRVLAKHPYRSNRLESVNASTPIVDGNRVFVSEDYGLGGTLLEFTGSQLEVVWTDQQRRDKSMNTHWNTPVLIDGFLYGSAGHSSANAQLRCVELATGEVRWSAPGLGLASLTFVDGHLLCLTEKGDLLLIQADPGRFEQVARLRDTGLPPFGRVPFEMPCWSAPIVSHGLLYIRDRARLYCFELIPQ